MDISIKYCTSWGYLSHASRVEAELKAKYPDARVELVKGSGGIFDVVCDNRLVYSKDQSQRFPNEGEVGKLIQEGAAK